MNVLSLFDGISCGQLALKKSGVHYDNYFASEVDEGAIKVTQRAFPETRQLGDVTKLEATSLPKIDLLIGGSPCTGFSQAGGRLNFDDPQSALFFQYIRLLQTVKPRYFFLENVKMKDEWVDKISELLGVEPVEVNSSVVSKQNRRRLYWTNIPKNPTPLVDKGLIFRKTLRTLPHGYMRESIKVHEKYPTLCAQSPGTKHRIVEFERERERESSHPGRV